MNELLLFYVTHPSEAHAKNVIDELLKENLIACANTYSMKSDYWWDNSICKDEEYMTILKTHPELEDKVESKIMTLHSYDVPCIIRYTVRCNEAYYAWVVNETLRKLTNKSK